MATVIVFGPTGSIASIAAITAAHTGAQKVYLAMRDPSKPIPNLSPAAEAAGPFARVHADLTKPATITAALAVSKATHAFVYLAFGSPDTAMRGTAAALKAGGVTFVVFLSSFTIGRLLAGAREGLRRIGEGEMVPYAHAAVEISLEEVFGAEGFVAIRPGGFATNLLRYREGVLAGEVRMFGPGFRMDMITPEDMGRVSGTILARGLPVDGQRKVYLYGPQFLSQREGLQIVADVLGKGEEFKVAGLGVGGGDGELGCTGLAGAAGGVHVEEYGG